MIEKFDEELRYENRCLRTRTGKLLFGPTGDRLAVDVLERQAGFVGCIDFIHKMNVTELFTVKCSLGMNLEQAKTVWHPTYMTMEYEDEDIGFQEKKTVIAQDVAISVMKWINHSDKPMNLTFLSVPEKFEYTEIECNALRNYLCYSESPELRFGIRLGIAACWNYSTNCVTVESGQTVTILAVAAVGNRTQESVEDIKKKAEEYINMNMTPEELFNDMVKENESFYDEAPQFLCDDRLINACWKYRWYILKNTISKPGMGNFPNSVMYEGRDHRMCKDALEPSGWEFSKLIPLSSPLHVNDLRWHPNHKLTKDIIQSAFAGQDDDGLILCSYVEEESPHRSYANYMIWSIWLNYLLDGDKEFVTNLLPQMKKYISGHEKTYMDENDSLLIERTHSLTGKEYQPSYWYFHDFPKNPKDRTTFTPLKRVDRSVYHYLNLCGLANVLKALKDPQEAIYRKKAEDIRKDINSKMWDEKTGFFYDLHYETGEKAFVRNIVGVYPYWAMMTEDNQQAGILPLMDKEAFDTGSAFSSVSKDCNAFSPDGGWKGNFFKGRNGCVWCGPSWPYTTGIALEALGTESRKREHSFDNMFDKYFMEYTTQHFRDGDKNRPYLVEHYNSVTGERLSDEADYNHSFWLDIVINYVAGVIVKEDCVEIEPLNTHLRWFYLDNINIRGHKLTIKYARSKDRQGIPQGLTVLVDGKPVANTKDGKALLVRI